MKALFESTGNQEEMERNCRINNKRTTTRHQNLANLELSSLQNSHSNSQWNSNMKNNPGFNKPIYLAADALRELKFSHSYDPNTLNKKKLEEYSNSIMMKSQISKYSIIRNANDYTFYFKNRASANSDLEWIYNLRKNNPINFNLFTMSKLKSLQTKIKLENLGLKNNNFKSM